MYEENTVPDRVSFLYEIEKARERVADSGELLEDLMWCITAELSFVDANKDVCQKLSSGDVALLACVFDHVERCVNGDRTVEAVPHLREMG